MNNTLIKWIVSALVVLVASYILPGVTVSGFFVAIVVALVLGLINTFIKPLAIIFTLPITIFTLGLFTFVIDALMIMLAAAIISGFEVRNFGWALLFSLILSVANSFLKDKIED